MSRFVKQGKAAFSSATSFKATIQTTRQDGKVRYNNDLLPSPPGKSYTANLKKDRAEEL
jgi:NCS1 family nucleobase:cation symporter-1